MHVSVGKEERNSVPITALLVLRRHNKILLLRRYNTGYEDGNYCFPGGHVEKGEPIHQALIREAKEEIGISIEGKNLNLIHVLNRKINDNAYVDFVFECTTWEGNPYIVESDKSDDLQWFNIKKIPINIIPFMKEVFKKNKQFYIPYVWR